MLCVCAKGWDCGTVGVDKVDWLVVYLSVLYLFWLWNRALYNFDFQVKFDIEGQGQSPPK